MKNLLIALFISFTGFICEAQTFPWARSGDGTGVDEGMFVTADTSGNIYITGEFSSPFLVFGTYTLTSSGGDMFLVKYSSTGNVLWAKSVGGNNYSQGNSIAIDKSNNIIQTGVFASTTVAFGTYTLNNSGTSGTGEIFLTKYNSNGNVIWARSIGGSSDDEGYSVSTDSLGNIFISGRFRSTPLVVGTSTIVSNGSGYAMFLAKFDSSGNPLWARAAGGGLDDRGLSVCNDKGGNAFITGAFSSYTFAIGSNTITNNNAYNIFFAKYDSIGNLLWAKFIPASGNGTNFGNSLSIDSNGNVFLAGSFGCSNLTIGSTTLTNTGGSDGFLAKFDNYGNALWAKCTYGSGYGGGAYSVSTDILNNAYVSGSFTNSMTIGTTTYSSPVNSDPMYIAKYDSNGNIICSTVLLSGGDDNNSIKADKFGNAYVTGDFLNANPFVVGSNTLNLTGIENIFLAKFNCQPDGIKMIDENSTSKLFPNPNNGTFKIENEIENGEIIFINSLGEKAYQQKVIVGANSITVSELPKGFYSYLIVRDKQTISSGKIIIE